jgi:hypothetical protein
MADFDVSRIVPSTRDLFGALATKREGLALVAEIGDGDDEAVAAEVARLDELDVRALAFASAGAMSRIVATSTASTPSICLAPIGDAEACQRARFFGADGVAVSDADLAKTAQSMHLMALAHVRSLDEARVAAGAWARALFISAPLELTLAIGAAVDRPTLLLAHVPDLDAAGARALSGSVDAAIVPVSLQRSAEFESILQELDT